MISSGTGAGPHRPSVLALAVAALVLGAGQRAYAAAELVRNPMLSSGVGDRPVAWTHEAYDASEGATRFEWTTDALGIGALAVKSTKPNDARWIQKVPVAANTWYRITGWIRVERVGTATKGAYLSVMGTFHDSRDLRGTQPWQPVGLWVKTGSLDTTITLACRLGGYSSLNSGTAWCTGISVVAAGLPPEEASQVYGGTPDSTEGGQPVWVQVVAILMVLGVVLLIWRYVMPASAQIPP